MLLAANRPERVTAAVLIGQALPLAEGRASLPFEEELDTDAELMRERLGAPVDYLPVTTGGAARAAELILAATA